MSSDAVGSTKSLDLRFKTRICATESWGSIVRPPWLARAGAMAAPRALAPVRAAAPGALALVRAAAPADMALVRAAALGALALVSARAVSAPAARGPQEVTLCSQCLLWKYIRRAIPLSYCCVCFYRAIPVS